MHRKILLRFTRPLASLFVCLSLAASLTLAACAPADSVSARPGPESRPLQVLTIGTADSGGTMSPVGSALAEAIEGSVDGLTVNVNTSSGSFANVRDLEQGQLDLALISGNAAGAAYLGSGEFEGEPRKDLRAIAAIYQSLSNWMSPESSGLFYVHDLAGHSAAIGPQDSASELAARLSLEAAGLGVDEVELVNLGLGSGSQQVLEGRLDAVHGFAGIPVSGLTQLAEAAPSRLLAYTDGELRRILSLSSFYHRAVIPAGTYPGQTEDVETFGIKCLLCVDASMDEDLVYSITRALDESREDLVQSHEAMKVLEQRDFMYTSLPIPLHPGAEKYYRDIGAELP